MAAVMYKQLYKTPGFIFTIEIKIGFSLWKYPLAPPLHQFLKTISILAGDLLVVPIGVSHISLRHKKYNQGCGRKEQITNEQYGLGLTQVQEG